MRFFHPRAGATFRPGESQRRRERHRQHEQARLERVAAVVAPTFTHDWWSASGRILAAEPCEARPLYESQTDGALRILSGCGYDPGNAAYRHHTAVNEFTKHADTFIRFGHSNPFCDLRQIDGLEANRGSCHKARALMEQADVIHSHVDYLLQAKAYNRPNMWRSRPDQLLIRHYHGSRPNRPDKEQWPILNMMEDDIANATLVGARLTLCALRSKMQWLPIAIPCRRYRAMVPKARRPGPFRIAHSPTRADYKGSADLVVAVETLRKRGLAIDLVMIERQPHGKALEMKADCDLTFDSFWLGIQGSGLEAAAMGQMVVAGDESVRDLYLESEVNWCPYTFAKDRAQLTEVLERAITDAKWYKSEAMMANEYVKDYHDYKAVAKRYEQIIAKAMNRTDVLTKRGKAA